MISTLIALSALILFCPLAENCFAQQNEKVKLRFVTFPPRQDWAEMELKVGEEKTIDIEVPSNELSKTYRITPSRILLLGKTVAAKANEDGFKVYARVELLPASSQIILLKSKGEALADGFEARAIDATSTKFGGGKLLFVNTASVAIAGVVGGEKFALKPNASSLLRPQANKGKDLYQVTFAYQKKEKWQVFSDTRWPISEKHRGLIFFVEDSDTKKLSLFAIRDSLKKKE
jgi:hypothetical protein